MHWDVLLEAFHLAVRLAAVLLLGLALRRIAKRDMNESEARDWLIIGLLALLIARD